MCWYSQGGVLKEQDQPQISSETCCQEVVLCAFWRVWISLKADAIISSQIIKNTYKMDLSTSLQILY